MDQVVRGWVVASDWLAAIKWVQRVTSGSHSEVTCALVDGRDPVEHRRCNDKEGRLPVTQSVVRTFGSDRHNKFARTRRSHLSDANHCTREEEGNVARGSHDGAELS